MRQEVTSDALYGFAMKLGWPFDEAGALMDGVSNFWASRLLQKIKFTDDAAIVEGIVEWCSFRVGVQYFGGQSWQRSTRCLLIVE
jgi:hypothetical protein